MAMPPDTPMPWMVKLMRVRREALGARREE